MAPIPIIIATTSPTELRELPKDPARDIGGHNDLNNEIKVNKIIISATKTNSKIYELRTYKKAVLNPIYAKQQKKIIEKDIQNLKNHQTWKFEYLPVDKKAVSSKQSLR